MLRCLVLVVLLFASSSPAGAENTWPPDFLRGAWSITESSCDGELVDEAVGNLLVFHDNQMLFAFDRKYMPPNPEVGAIGYKFYGIKTQGSTCLGLVRVQRGKLKFMLEHKEAKGKELISIQIEDYAGNRVREVVKFTAERVNTESARKRIRRLLDSPKLKVFPVTQGFIDTLRDWASSESDAERGPQQKSSKAPEV